MIEQNNTNDPHKQIVDNLLREKIHDDNDEYKMKYQDTLFLEAEVDDNKKAALKDVYIIPNIKTNNLNTEFDLQKWMQDCDSRIVLLYGKAGIGKTSLLSWIAFTNSFKQECHILELRKYSQNINIKNPWVSIKKCFNCENDSAYENKIIILDGLDEICVLNNEFNGNIFIDNLRKNISTGFGRNIRIIITSRMGYFKEIEKNIHIDSLTIGWSEDTVIKWCDAYCSFHQNRKLWSESFKKAYNSLDKMDKRKDIFCSPLILYICCIFQIDISKHKSVASIYDEAFNIVGKRRYNELDVFSEKTFEINWQFTKELAFQMFINDKLEDTLQSDFVHKAKQKVIKWAQRKNIEETIEPEFKKLYAINHFSFNRNEAVEFAHKTVVEYFVAVKIYEDFFEHILDESIEESDNNTEVWHNIFNAFRYKKIPMDIMKYLTELIIKKKNDTWKNKFFKAYYIGIKEQALTTVAELKSEYSTSHTGLINQIHIAFRNLTWFLTYIGFNNKHFNNTSEQLEILSSYIKGDVNLSGWAKLDYLNLSNIDLEGANLSTTCLNNVNLNQTNLSDANLQNTTIRFAFFQNTSLKNAYLQNAHLEDTHFTDVCLLGAKLTDTHLERTSFFRTSLIDAHLDGAHLDGATFKSVNLQGANLKRASIERVYFEGALSDIYLLESDLPKYDECVLQGDVNFFQPIVETNDKRKKYNPKTNRMEIK